LLAPLPSVAGVLPVNVDPVKGVRAGKRDDRIYELLPRGGRGGEVAKDVLGLDLNTTAVS